MNYPKSYLLTETERKARDAYAGLVNLELQLHPDSALPNDFTDSALLAELEHSYISLAVYLHRRHSEDCGQIKENIRYFRSAFDESLQAMKDKTGAEILDYAQVAYAVWSAFVHDREHAFAPDEKYVRGLTGERIREQIADLISPKNIGVDKEIFESSVKQDIQNRLHRRINVDFNEKESLASLVAQLL